MYAIIETGGKQYKVAEGDVVQVEKLNAEPGNEVTFDKVIAVSDGAMKVADAVASAKVTGTVMGYHKKNGHRQPYTSVKIDKISL